MSLRLSLAVITLACLPFMVQAEEGQRPAKPKPVNGTIGSVGSDSISVLVGKEGAAETVELKVDADTKILVESAEDEPVAEGENKKPKPKMTEAKLADLKQGQRVNIRHADGKALHIVVKREPPKRDAGEKPKGQGEARKPKPKKEGDTPENQTPPGAGDGMD